MSMNIRLLMLVFLSGLAVTSCKSHKEVVAGYKYLITEDGEKKPLADNAGTSGSTNETNSTRITASASASEVIQKAESYLGVPYRYGGINENGIDCSGLTRKSYSITGVELPRSADDQSKFGAKVRRSDLAPGDLVFFSAKNNGKIDHVGLVTEVNGDDVVFIHASSSNGVRYDKLNEGYWKNLFKLGRRVELRDERLGVSE
jgi:cell wall-associated NlpC family hydrolase